MYDLFISDHREFVLTDREPVYLSDEAFELAQRLARTPLKTVPDMDMINRDGSVGDHCLVINYWLRKFLKAQGIKTKSLERLFLETVLLNKLHHCPAFDQSKTTLVSIGAMTQQRLTLLLSSVADTQWQPIYALKKQAGINAFEWTSNLAGADAAASVLMTLAKREGARIFLPSVHEDACLGIDLFWLEKEMRMGVSIKCIRKDNHYAYYEPRSAGIRACIRTEQIRIRHIPTGQPDREEKTTTEQMNAIACGTALFEKHHGVFLEPVLIQAHALYAPPISKGKFQSQETWPDELLAQIQRYRDLSLQPLQITGEQ